MREMYGRGATTAVSEQFYASEVPSEWLPQLGSVIVASGALGGSC